MTVPRPPAEPLPPQPDPMLPDPPMPDSPMPSEPIEPDPTPPKPGEPIPAAGSGLVDPRPLPLMPDVLDSGRPADSGGT